MFDIPQGVPDAGSTVGEEALHFFIGHEDYPYIDSSFLNAISQVHDIAYEQITT